MVKYYVTFFDDYYRYTKVYLLKNMMLLMCFSYKAEVENPLDKIKNKKSYI